MATQQNTFPSRAVSPENKSGHNSTYSKSKVITAPRNLISTNSLRLEIKLKFYIAWAKDEPPSPTLADVAKHDENVIKGSFVRPHTPIARPARSSDTISAVSTSLSQDDVISGPGWWSFTRRARKEAPPDLPAARRPNLSYISSMPSRQARLFREISKTWLSQKKDFQEGDQGVSSDQNVEVHAEGSNSHSWDFNIPHPSTSMPFTLAHARTPGWDTPWSPRTAGDKIEPMFPEVESVGHGDVGDTSGAMKEGNEALSGITLWQRRRKRLRLFFLNNNYVPVVCLYLLFLCCET